MAPVLLIDDDDVCNFIMSRALKIVAPDAEVLTARNGKEGINLLKDSFIDNSKVPSIIFLDLNMPVMDGFEFLDAYKMLNGPKDNIKIVIVTSSNHSNDRTRAQAAGVNDFILKPVDDKKLLAFFQNAPNRG